jgi:pimeloyl-ACP methyl ester carboxylesterase
MADPIPPLVRGTLAHDGLTFSYLERRPAAPKGVLLILHAHWMGASDFADVIPWLPTAWHVLALDQRGHGETSHGGSHSIDAYCDDIDALLDKCEVLGPVVILGHSFGGRVANLYAARQPERVRGLILEDIEVARDDHDAFILPWAGRFPSRDALEAKIGKRLAPYLAKSIVQEDAPNGGGWRLAFEPTEILESECALNGDHWAEWMSHTCPALVIRGARSVPVDGKVLAEMARHRPNTEFAEIDAGHSVHIDAPQPFIETVNRFLARLS